ncbi:MAG TPA: F0F1 ATP synthase subunit B [Candidatus Polarisedimenticolaceae bacterium]|nr:F0F1 ATP synthase subunit B [Candidatus Polarisedimenticolaceae bacterium]
MSARLLTLPILLAATALPVAAEEGEHAAAGASALITPEIGLMFWTLVTFVILLVLLGKFAWKPIMDAMNAREAGIKGDLDRARGDREEAERLLVEHRALIDQARRERAEAVEAGRKDAERLKGEILDEARKQKDQLVQQAQTQIEAGLRQARGELKSVAADLAIQVAGKLIGSNLDDATQRRLVEDYLADLERLGASGSERPH